MQSHVISPSHLQNMLVKGSLDIPAQIESCFAERDPEPIVPSRIEPLLFSALDRETDIATSVQLKETISTLLAASADSQPSQYLAICSAVILAASSSQIAEPSSEIADDAASGTHQACFNHEI